VSHGNSQRNALLAAIALLLVADLAFRLCEAPKQAHGEAPKTRAERLEARRDRTVRAITRAGKAVANIATEQVIASRPRLGRSSEFDEFFNRFFGKTQRSRSLGSGVLIHSSGYIVTNAHVVAQASKIVVTLPDNQSFAAKLVSLSEADDLALLKVEAPEPLPVLRLGEAEELMIGETVIAMGNPFGLENSVTRGVLSARDRRIKRAGKTLSGTFLQTDAAINPGNSGGALINLDAELIGINSAVHATGQGIGFAIPVGQLRKSLARLSSPELVRDLWIGLEVERRDRKLYVSKVVAGSPADIANLAPGDRLMKVGAAGQAPGSVFELHEILLAAKGSVPVVLKRKGKLYKASLEPKPSPAVEMVARRLGARVRSMAPGTGVLIAVRVHGGVMVESVRPRSPAALSGMTKGDIISQVERLIAHPLHGRARQIFSLNSVRNLAAFLQKLPAKESMGVVVYRGQRELRGELRLD